MKAAIEFREAAVPDLVSCIVPVYNGERFLAEALDSILAQSYEPLEILVVDDGSTDGTPDVVAGYGERVRYVAQGNAGPAAARNRGLEASKGELLAFLDADDLWVTEKLALQVRTLRERPELDFCVGHILNFWMPERQAEAEEHADHPYHQLRPGFSPCTLLARRVVFERVGGFSTELRTASDNDWFLRVMDLRVPHALLPDMLARRRLHPDNLTRPDLASREVLLQNLKASLDRRRGTPS